MSAKCGKPKSSLWKYATVQPSESGKPKAKCNLCNHVMSKQIRSLRNHLSRCAKKNTDQTTDISAIIAHDAKLEAQSKAKRKPDLAKSLLHLSFEDESEEMENEDNELPRQTPVKKRKLSDFSSVFYHRMSKKMIRIQNMRLMRLITKRSLPLTIVNSDER
eukprot:314533_1